MLRRSSMMGLHDPGGELGEKLLEAQPEVGEFASGDIVGCHDVAVVEEVFVEKDCVVGVDFDRANFRVASVGEFGPAVEAIPTFAKTTSVIEDDLCCDREDKVALAMEVDSGEVLDLLFVFGFGEPPLGRIGGDLVDGVVEDLRSVDGLVEEGTEAGVGGRGGGVVGITSGGERWG